MPRYAFVVYTNPVPGREQEYNDWYTGRHLDDLLAIPGVVSGRRFLLSAAQIQPAPPHKYLAIYEVEADNPQSFLDALMSRAGTDQMPVSAALMGDAAALLWEAI